MNNSDFSDDEEEINGKLAVSANEIVLMHGSSLEDGDGDEDDENNRAGRRRRSKSFYMEDDTNNQPVKPALRKSSQSGKRALRDREKQALEDGLDYHGAGVGSGRRRAPSLDISDISDSDVERPSLDADGPEHSTKRPLTNRKMRRFKMLMLGDMGVGKTSLMRKWTGESVDSELVSTAGVDFTTKIVTVKGEALQVQIWDTAGQERFHIITHSYYRGCNGILLVYDAENSTPTKLNYWIDNIQRHAGNAVEVLLLCNKIGA